MKRSPKAVCCMVLSLSMVMSTLSGCGKGEPEAVQETQKMETGQNGETAEEKGRKTEDESAEKEETADSAEEESSKEDLEFQEQVAQRIEEYKEKLDKSTASHEEQLEYVRKDVQADFLQTLQVYYISMDNYTTEESTIGDLITSTVADSICNEVAGGSSTVSTALVTAAKGIHAGDAPGEIVTNTFVDAMEELPNEVTARVYDYLLGETVLKALDVLQALATNRQIQHLANIIHEDIRNDVREMSHICSKEELSLEDCYKGMALADTILESTYEIEQVLRVNAGSGAWRPFYQTDEEGEHYGNYISSDLNEIAFHIQQMERIQRCREVLDSLEHVEKASEEEVAEASLKTFTWPRYSSFGYVTSLEDQVKSMYDWNDAGERSQRTKFWNVADSLLGNPITSIFVEDYNQQEGRFADALAEFNAEARAVWLEQYIPLKCKLEHFSAYTAYSDGGGVLYTEGGGDEIDQAIAMAFIKAQYGEDVSEESFLEIHGEKLSGVYRDLFALYESTRILYDTYYLAMVDSEGNTNFLNNYRSALTTLDKAMDFCPKEETKGDRLPPEFTCENEYCVKIAAAARKLMDFYIENIDERPDMEKRANINFPNDEGIPITCTIYVKSPANGVEEDYVFAGSLHRDGFKDMKAYGHRNFTYSVLFSQRDCFWIQDENSGVDGHMTFKHQEPDISDASLISDEVLTMRELSSYVWTVCWELSTNSDPLIIGVPQIFEFDVAACRKKLEEEIASGKKKKKEYEDRKQPFLDIQARIEAGEDVIWANPEELEKRYIETYVKTAGYQKLLEFDKLYGKGEGSISREPEGFGTLTCTQPLTRQERYMNGYNYVEYQSLYKTGGGKELKIVLTECWYDENGKSVFLDFFLPEIFYDGATPGIILSPVEGADLDMLDMVEP